jgi:poly(ADP-ribose) polymerase-like protein
MSPGEESPADPQLPAYVIEGARSNRASCKACRRKIDKGALRLGVLIEGPFGTGYLWFHLKCAAKRRIEDVEEAYASRAWAEGVEVPPLESLRKLAEESEQERKAKPVAPYAERSPSGRAKCKQCGEALEQGALRIVVLREVQFGNQIRKGPITVHPRCVREALDAPDSAHGGPLERAGFLDALRANTLALPAAPAGERAIDPAELERVAAEIGSLA